jgi:hypothetical protein
MNVTRFSCGHWCYWKRQLRELVVEARSDNKNSVVFCEVRPCSPIEVHWRFGEMYVLLFPGWRVSQASNQKEEYSSRCAPIQAYIWTKFIRNLSLSCLFLASFLTYSSNMMMEAVHSSKHRWTWTIKREFRTHLLFFSFILHVLPFQASFV